VSDSNRRWRWSYCLAKADGTLEMEFADEPIKESRISELLGGTYIIRPLQDGTAIAFRRHSEDLPVNPHYPGLRGHVLVGKLDNNVFVGALGVAIQ
jgi:hypothetical protein